ncbi:MAG: MscS family membrane protein [Bacteroidia bacterium]|jgi:small-conductance mechanosensitive channel
MRQDYTAMNPLDQTTVLSPTSLPPLEEAPAVSESSSAMDPMVDWVRDQLADATSSPWGQAAIAMGAFLLLAKLIEILLSATCKLLLRRTRTLLDDRIVELLRKPVLQSVILIGVVVTVAVLEPSAGTEQAVKHVASTLIALAWSIFLLRGSKVFLQAASDEKARFQLLEQRTYPLFSNLATVVIVAVTTWVVINIWGADMTGWLASAGVVGIAVGFAAKDTLANLFAGVFVIADAPFRVGDYIVLDTGDRGQVVHIGLRSTRLLTRSDVEITIPNSVIASGRITNQSSGPYSKMRVKLPVQVAYGSDIDLLREILLELAAAEGLVQAAPIPNVRFRAMADSGLNFELMFWVEDPSLRGRAVDALNTAVYKRLTKEGIEIPYPKRDVYLHQAE